MGNTEGFLFAGPRFSERQRIVLADRVGSAAVSPGQNSFYVRISLIAKGTNVTVDTLAISIDDCKRGRGGECRLLPVC